MVAYAAPVDDIRFVLYDLLDYEGTVAGLSGYEEGSPEIIDAILEEAARFCQNELLPLNATGDAEGCTFENGVVRTPKGFKEAYRAFAEGGWTGLSCDPAYGGQGLPMVIRTVLDELICSSNLSFGIYPGLSLGAYDAIAHHGSAEQKRLFLPRLAAGEWSGTMCLTEPQCGTDLGLIRTKAVPDGDGVFDITGTKIFISAGEHDLTDNIVHLVLARLPDAPPGIRGISLFVVPKFLVDADGAPGARNGVSCSAIESKMGIKASSTCVMNFDAAKGSLIGLPHKGMRCMFTMMNTARLGVGVQGLGLAETAYQTAVAYARERLQGRALSGPSHPDKAADPIIVHPDIRRTLLTMRAFNEASRALALWIGMSLDVAARHPDPDRRAEADDLVALMTPVIKAFCTDHGSAAANLSVQIFGGHGYIRDNGVEQLVRDARITQLYEGTNGIQALDLVGRKLGQHAGRLLRRFFHPVAAFIEDNMDDAGMQPFVLPLAKAFARLQQATIWIAQEGLKDPNQGAAGATSDKRRLARVALGDKWARSAKVASKKHNGGTEAFYQAKLATGRFYMTHLLPETSGLLAQITAGAAPVMDFREEWM